MINLSMPQVMPLESDANGVVRVGKTRVTLDTVIKAFCDGSTAEEIVQQYPSLNLADVYSVIAYYMRSSDEIETYFQQRGVDAETVRQRNESSFDPRGIRDRLLARRSGKA
ncbi:MAG: DUF433 domain-containing protein [Methylococcales bacterium]